MIRLIRATQTAMGCPAQWDAWDEDGNYYYLRYRNGCGAMQQYKDEDWKDAPWKENVDESIPGWAIRANTSYIRTVATFQHGGPYDGFMDLDEFAKHAGIELAPELMETSFGQMLADKMILEGIVGPEKLEES